MVLNPKGPEIFPRAAMCTNSNQPDPVTGSGLHYFCGYSFYECVPFLRGADVPVQYEYGVYPFNTNMK